MSEIQSQFHVFVIWLCYLVFSVGKIATQERMRSDSCSKSIKNQNDVHGYQ